MRVNYFMLPWSFLIIPCGFMNLHLLLLNCTFKWVTQLCSSTVTKVGCWKQHVISMRLLSIVTFSGWQSKKTNHRVRTPTLNFQNDRLCYHQIKAGSVCVCIRSFLINCMHGVVVSVSTWILSVLITRWITLITGGIKRKRLLTVWKIILLLLLWRYIMPLQVLSLFGSIGIILNKALLSSWWVLWLGPSQTTLLSRLCLRDQLVLHFGANWYKSTPIGLDCIYIPWFPDDVLYWLFKKHQKDVSFFCLAIL